MHGMPARKSTSRRISTPYFCFRSIARGGQLSIIPGPVNNAARFDAEKLIAPFLKLPSFCLIVSHG